MALASDSSNSGPVGARVGQLRALAEEIATPGTELNRFVTLGKRR